MRVRRAAHVGIEWTLTVRRGQDVFEIRNGAPGRECLDFGLRRSDEIDIPKYPGEEDLISLV